MRPPGRRLFAHSLGFAALFALVPARPARAADSCQPAPLLGACVNSDTFWPHAGASHFAAVGGTETVGDGRLGFGLVTTYLSRPIVLHIPSPGPGGSDQYAINDQVNGSFLWSYGVSKRLELDLVVPITFGQGGTGLAPITGSTSHLHDTAIRDLRFGLAYALLRDPGAAFGVTARMDVSAPTGDRDQFAGDRSVVFVPSVAADYHRGRWFAGWEVGVRVRETEELLGARVGTQGSVAMGLGYDVLPRPDLLSAMVEARSLPTFSSQQTASETTSGLVAEGSGSFLAPSEWMVSLRSSPRASGDFSIQAGGGGAIPTGDASLTVPRFRFMIGVRFAPGAADRDNDSVADALDKCPDVHAETKDGCPAPPDSTPALAPAPAGAPVEIPRLDLAGPRDRCPDDPDSVDGFKDTDGCPDEDTDKDGIDDRHDQCPLVPEDYAGLTDGCPQGKSTP
jgi:hypothetical protein